MPDTLVPHYVAELLENGRPRAKPAEAVHCVPATMSVVDHADWPYDMDMSLHCTLFLLAAVVVAVVVVVAAAALLSSACSPTTD